MGFHSIAINMFVQSDVHIQILSTNRYFGQNTISVRLTSSFVAGIPATAAITAKAITICKK
jgi:hypothetical protein